MCISYMKMWFSYSKLNPQQQPRCRVEGAGLCGMSRHNRDASPHVEAALVRMHYSLFGFAINYEVKERLHPSSSEVSPKVPAQAPQERACMV